MEEYKIVLGRLMRFCSERWPDEFKRKYIGPQEEFRDWLNEKTGLSVNHLQDKEGAIRAWTSSIEGMP